MTATKSTECQVHVQLDVTVGVGNRKVKLAVNQTYTGTGTALSKEVRAALAGMTRLADQAVTQCVSEDGAT